jgi:integrase
MNDRTVGQLWVAYARHGLSRLSPYTRDGYVKVWRLRIEPHLADTPVAALTVGAVEDWLADLYDAGLSWNTVRNAKVTLGAMLTFAARREEGVTLPHVAQRAQLPGEEPVGRVTVPVVEQVAAVLTELLVSDIELATFERIAAVTGARRGEIGALRVDDVYPDGLMFDEAVRMELVDHVAALSIGATKTKQRRFVECDDITMATIEAWLAHCGRSAPRALLFAGADGGPVHPERWSHRWRRACALRGISTHQHALRHMVGTLTAETLGLRVAQERLGHARVGTTQRYAKVRAIQGSAAAEVMASALRQ